MRKSLRSSALSQGANEAAQRLGYKDRHEQLTKLQRIEAAQREQREMQEREEQEQREREEALRQRYFDEDQNQEMELEGDNGHDGDDESDICSGRGVLALG